jgi:isochorismate hydrolase
MTSVADPDCLRREHSVTMSDEIPALDPEHTAFLVMDFQYGTLDAIPHSEELLDRMVTVIALARRAGVQIAHVWVAFEDDDYAAVPATNTFWTAVAEGRLLHRADPARAIHHKVAPEPGDIVVRKTRIGPFSTTDLDEQLRRRGITTIVLAGISTGGGRSKARGPPSPPRARLPQPGRRHHFGRIPGPPPCQPPRLMEQRGLSVS